jgi:hypothetical protein
METPRSITEDWKCQRCHQWFEVTVTGYDFNTRIKWGHTNYPYNGSTIPVSNEHRDLDGEAVCGSCVAADYAAQQFSRYGING